MCNVVLAAIRPNLLVEKIICPPTICQPIQIGLEAPDENYNVELSQMRQNWDLLLSLWIPAIGDAC